MPSRSLGSLNSPGVREYEADQDNQELEFDLEGSPSYNAGVKGHTKPPTSPDRFDRYRPERLAVLPTAKSGSKLVVPEKMTSGLHGPMGIISSCSVKPENATERMNSSSPFEVT